MYFLETRVLDKNNQQQKKHNKTESLRVDRSINIGIKREENVQGVEREGGFLLSQVKAFVIFSFFLNLWLFASH